VRGPHSRDGSRTRAIHPSRSARASAERPFYARHADAYDLLVDDPVEPWVEAVHDTVARTPGPILDAGCGTGRHAAALIALGHRVDLVDASAALLSQAAARCPSARTRLADLCALEVCSPYAAVTCRGVLNDMITDAERTAAVRSLAGCLTRGGVLILDVREREGSRRRADGMLRSRRVALGHGGTLTVHSRKTWSGDLLLVEETYELTGTAPPAHYRFAMRPWTGQELREVLREAGFAEVEIRPGAGRRTPDRYFVVAR
jgi:SAM-dependent methyltransferase